MAAAFFPTAPLFASVDAPVVDGDLSSDAEAQRALAYVELFNDPGRAARLAGEALAAAQASSAAELEAYAALTLCLAKLLDEEHDSGLAMFERVESLVRRLGEPRADWLMSDARALALLRGGQPDEALVELIRLMIGSSESRPARDCFLSIASLTRVHATLGHADEALGSAYRALSIARRTGSVSLRVHALTLLGERQLDLNHPAAARLALELASRGAVRANSHHLQTRAAVNLIRTYAALGETTLALEEARAQQARAPQARVDRDGSLTPSFAGALALACVVNAHFEEARAWLGASDVCGSLHGAWLQGRIDLAQGRVSEADRLCREWAPRLADTRPTHDTLAFWLTAVAVGEAQRDAQLNSAWQARAEETRVALAEDAAHARTLSQEFETSILEANPVCCAMNEAAPVCR
jgi:tetratricopeptide (TPR) repeat protein